MFADTTRSLEAFRALRPDWDLAGAPAIDARAIATALELIGSIAGVAPRRGMAWRDPQVGPDPEGGVDLHWQAAGTWLLVSVPAGGFAHVQLATQRPGGAPKLRWASLAEAAGAVVDLWEASAAEGVA